MPSETVFPSGARTMQFPIYGDRGFPLAHKLGLFAIVAYCRRNEISARLSYDGLTMNGL